MPVIVFASGKGGVSKTTLAASLATLWARQGKNVQAVDSDPNGHLCRWLARIGDERITAVHTDEAEITESIKSARKIAGTDGIIVVDVAGAHSLGLAKAALQADLIVIPSKVGDLDTAEAARTYRTVADFDRGNRAVAIVTQADPRTTIAAHARDQLAADGLIVLNTGLSHRVAYPEATVAGMSPLDMGKTDIVADIEAIGAELLARVEGLSA